MSAPIAELSAIQASIDRAQKADPKGWEALQGQSQWEIYTDGSAPIKNPGGAIGWSSVFLLDEGRAWEVFGGIPGRTSDPPTSNNRAEIAGALTIIEVIYRLKQAGLSLPQTVEIVSDSQYVVHCAQGKWKKHKNKDLWRRFDQMMCVTRQAKIKLKFRWTRAHVGTEWNERADVLANDGAMLAIGKSATADFPQAEVAQEEQPKPAGDYQYLLQLYSEMKGKSRAKGTYRLCTPQRERSETLPLADVITLDEAEYHLLLKGLGDLLETLTKAERKPEEFKILVDSSRDLMLKQIQGHYGVKSERLQPLHKKATNLARKFAGVQWQKSKKADLKDALKSW